MPLSYSLTDAPASEEFKGARSGLFDGVEGNGQRTSDVETKVGFFRRQELAEYGNGPLFVSESRKRFSACRPHCGVLVLQFRSVARCFSSARWCKREKAAVTSGIKAARVACGPGMRPGFVRTIPDRFAVPATSRSLEVVAVRLVFEVHHVGIVRRSLPGNPDRRVGGDSHAGRMFERQPSRFVPRGESEVEEQFRGRTRVRTFFQTAASIDGKSG